MLKSAIPVFHVNNSSMSDQFYCRKLGFKREFAYYADESLPDPCYMGLSRDQVEIHISSFSGDGIAGSTILVLVEDVDSLYRELVRNGVTISLTPTDQKWGNREMYIIDLDGNDIRFV